MPHPRHLLLATVAIAALAAGLLFGLRSHAPAAPLDLAAFTVLDAPRALPDFTLSSGAAALTPASLTGRWTLVFFGFASCPDICPTTLSLLAQVDRQLADLPPGTRPEVLFVSVDPERDTPAAAQTYAAHFAAGFHGATGEMAELTRLAGALGAPFVKVPLAGADGYTVDHSGAIFVIDPAARFRAVATPPLVALDIAADLRRLVTR